jgi:hypothetical protein
LLAQSTKILRAIPDEFLSDIVDTGFGVICIDRGQERFAVQIDLNKAIIFPAEHLLLPLFQYSVGIDVFLQGILIVLRVSSAGIWITGAIVGEEFRAADYS